MGHGGAGVPAPETVIYDHDLHARRTRRLPSRVGKGLPVYYRRGLCLRIGFHFRYSICPDITSSAHSSARPSYTSCGHITLGDCWNLFIASILRHSWGVIDAHPDDIKPAAISVVMNIRFMALFLSESTDRNNGAQVVFPIY